VSSAYFLEIDIMIIRHFVLLCGCLAMLGCNSGPRQPTEAELKVMNDKMASDMAGMQQKLPAKVGNPNDPMKGMNMNTNPNTKK
jgi:hypothetical protein